MASAAPLRRIVLPAEHGVWGLAAGAAIVGLALSSQLAGSGLILAAVAAVILRQGALSMAQPGRRMAGTVVVAGSLAAAICGILVVSTAAPGQAWVGWSAAAVAMGLPALLPVRRHWLLSAASGVSFALLAGGVASAGGAPASWCVAAASALGGHFIAMVPLVRAQTRTDPAWASLALDVHVGLLLAAVGCWAAHLLPSGIPLIFALGLARCVMVVDKRTTMSAKQAALIGTRELAWLPVLAACLAATLRGGL